jgi:hypothetical protein
MASSSKFIANVGYLSHTQPLVSKYDIFSIFELNKLQTGLLMFKCMKMKSLLPQTFQNYFTLNSDIHRLIPEVPLRTKNKYQKIFISLFWSTFVEFITKLSY